ncbi:hypothetical protein CJJ43_01315 [Listeria monocytogenes]|uniref:Imm51 family immunity protein n=1 Tax=Listeria monocytogenes TaxID=1639 RepID=UPI000F15B49D|nr:Imm51 family immunity protein [Listeria monocytogenes]MCY61162.1 hypothetical protein [Listeria monocytogenes serotype 4c]EAC9871334.1 hypothetical protein [Listeria monocytogenes]EAD5762701.1 hypothetical protein [Listeria monocytogenes]EAE6567904.1 hypothetical protein [Listeria monocytogenes]EAF1657637.1 hypothetical protein [Listeria monocytogenes]
MNKYLELHLENIIIPDNYKNIVTETGEWFYEETTIFSAFDLNIIETTRGTNYECALDPFNDESEDMKELNNIIENNGYEVNGYGWEDYFSEYIQKNYSDFSSKVGTDSESDTCGIYVMDSLEDYKELLGIISKGIRSLLS